MIDLKETFAEYQKDKNISRKDVLLKIRREQTEMVDFYLKEGNSQFAEAAWNKAKGADAELKKAFGPDA